MATNLTLYSYWRSTASWRVRIGLHYKQIPFHYEAVHLVQGGGQQRSDSHRALNAMQQVPVLVLADGRRITQSLAILEYLEETHPSPALLPSDPFLRSKVRQLAEIVNSGIQPLQNIGTTQYVKETLKGDDRAWMQHFIRKGLTGLEAEAAPFAGRFMVGDTPSFADITLVPQLYAARRNGVELDGFATLLRVEASCGELDAFAKAHPDRQPDKE